MIGEVDILDHLIRDLCFALRSLAKDRRFSLLAIFALALGIGASTVVFGVFYSLLFNAFAARDSSRLVIPSIDSSELAVRTGASLSPLECTPESLDAIRDAFEDVACYGHGSVLLQKNGGDLRRFISAYVSANAFEMYGAPALLGRAIVPADGARAAMPVFVISYKTWQLDFNGDPAVLGKSFVLNNESRTLVGIMPPRFQAFGTMVRMWLPNDIHVSRPPGGAYTMARLKPGATLAEASADMDVRLQRLAASHPLDFPKHFIGRAQSVADFLLGPWGIGSVGGSEFGMKRMIYILFAAVIMLLLIASSNVANLLLARATVREKEIAIRAALGASRGRLVRQLLVESFVLALGACAIGTMFACAGLKWAGTIIPQKGISIGGETVFSLSAPVLFFALGVTVLTTLLCGLAPALHSVRDDLQIRLASSGKGVNGSFRHGKFRAGLVVFEVALSIVLLVGAGLIFHSFIAITRVDLGFDRQHVLLAAFGRPADETETPQERNAFLSKVVQHLRMVPGVTDAAVNNSLPGYNPARMGEITLPGMPHAEKAGIDACSEGLLHVLSLQLIRGRWLSEADVGGARPVTVINETLARRLFGDGNPIGHQVQIKIYEKSFEIVGVIRDMKNFGPEEPVRPQSFVPFTIGDGGILLLRTRVTPDLLIHAVQQQISALDHGVIWGEGDVEAVNSVFERLTYSATRFGLMALAPLAGIGMLLVIIGVFSVMAYTVSLRTREIGIRMALGAQQRDIFCGVLKEGLGLVVVGLVIGVGVSFFLTRFLEHQIWGVSAVDPWTFGAVVVVIVAVGVAACLSPARRATRVDPMISLRYE
jgi:putative ABC transport system permease protein